jgi:hypothetical protein
VTIRYGPPPCPQDPAHGPLLSWVSANSGFMCPHTKHRGWPFFKTDLSPASRPAQHPNGTVSLAGEPNRASEEAAALVEVPDITSEPAAVPPGGSGPLSLGL